jgi:hypothetical protein
VVSLFVWPAVGSLLAVLASATITFVDLGLETCVGGSLKLLSLYSTLLLLLVLCCCRITSDFFVNKLHAEGYLLPLAEQVTKTFQVLVDQLSIDLQLLASSR